MNRCSGEVSAIIALIVAGLSLLLFSCLTPSIMVTREQNTGDELFNRHEYNSAIEHYEKMLSASSKLGIYRNLSMEAAVCRKVANCHEMTGRYEQALEYVTRALKLDSADNNLLGRIEDYRHTGKIHIYTGSYYRGVSSLEKALQLSEKLEQSFKTENRLSIAGNYLALGQLYAVMGRSDLSLKNIDKALSIYRSAGESRGEMEAYLTLGTVSSDQGDLLTAGRFIENSLKIAEKIKAGTSRHYQLLASLSLISGEYEKALKYQEKALNDARQTGIAAQIIWATVGMGDIYRDLGDIHRAEDFYRKAREAKDTISMQAESLDASIGLRLGDIAGAERYFSTEGSLTGNAITSLRMAELMIGKNMTDSAGYYLDISLKAFNITGNKLGLANVLLLKGKLLLDTGDLPASRTCFDSVLTLTGSPELKWQVFYQKGRLYEKSGDDSKAADAYMNAVMVIEKIRGNLTLDEFRSKFLESKREVYDRLINVLLRNKKEEEAFRISEQARARAFYDILSNRKIDFRGSVPGDLVALEQEKRFEMQKLYDLLQKIENVTAGTLRGSEIDNVKESISRAQEEYEDIIRRIKLSNPSYANMVAAEPAGVEKLIQALDDHTAVLSYWVSDDNLIIWMITRKGSDARKIIAGSDYLASLTESARKAVQSNRPVESDQSLSALYNILVQPFKEDLTKFERLVIIPNGTLHFLPFQALKNSEGRYLVEQFSIIYAPSASVYLLTNERSVPPGDNFMGVALSDVTVDNKPGLPGTDLELKNILTLFPRNISASGLSSTETFVKRNAAGSNIIHFATHGTYNFRQPLYSCLLFPPGGEDDGRLNVWEVLEMKLNARLVTLSACETGLGNITGGDEITGLSRAFLFAGSSAVVVSLWSVADYPTSLLMTSFYRHLKTRPAGEALAFAQREIMKTYPQPLYWAPFVLIGNGNVTGE